MKSVDIRLGGVPEHFNLPIHLAIEQGSFAKKGVNLTWRDFNGGTGAMTKALRQDEVDACILLTEGMIKEIIDGNPSKIISNYVLSPLIWGIHTFVDNPLNHHSDIFDKQYAISRLGSGSHLMAIVDAEDKGADIQPSQFTVIKNLDGALESLRKGETDVFYWEKYTTKPYVDSGLLKRVGEFLTPWPCFVIAATDRILNEQPEAIIAMLEVIHEAAASFMHDKHAITSVSTRYNQQVKDVERWYHHTEWSTHGWVSNKMLEGVIYSLQAAEIVSKEAIIPELIWRR